MIQIQVCNMHCIELKTLKQNALKGNNYVLTFLMEKSIDIILTEKSNISDSRMHIKHNL